MSGSSNPETGKGMHPSFPAPREALRMSLSPENQCELSNGVMYMVYKRGFVYASSLQAPSEICELTPPLCSCLSFFSSLLLTRSSALPQGIRSWYSSQTSGPPSAYIFSCREFQNVLWNFPESYYFLKAPNSRNLRRLLLGSLPHASLKSIADTLEIWCGLSCRPTLELCCRYPEAFAVIIRRRCGHPGNPLRHCPEIRCGDTLKHAEKIPGNAYFRGTFCGPKTRYLQKRTACSLGNTLREFPETPIRRLKKKHCENLLEGQIS